ncbi:hypothetical protein [Nocardia harenae]|uniref:hypothetical protein n=1 Tax=Nocardia harenae TaxID=358707 RepID=UPI000AD2E695|nr:hypothetical protein [Nocardia harenae]
MSPDLSKASPEPEPPEQAPETAAEATEAAPGERAPRLRTAVTAVAAALLVVALGAALWFGGGWVRAAFFTDGPRAEARDAALDGARQAAVNITSMNIDDVPGSLAKARSSMTGAILESATTNQQKSEQMATQSGTRMESTVLGAALTSLTSERDRATALVVLQVTEHRQDTSTARYRYTWSLDMTEVDDVWKVEQVATLGQPVLLDDGNAGAPAQPAAPETQAPAPQPGP